MKDASLQEFSMISAIIPRSQRGENRSMVVRFARRAAGVGEGFVVDNGSIDETPELATQAGAVVLTSSLQGKGASMSTGGAVDARAIFLGT